MASNVSTAMSATVSATAASGVTALIPAVSDLNIDHFSVSSVAAITTAAASMSATKVEATAASAMTATFMSAIRVADELFGMLDWYLMVNVLDDFMRVLVLLDKQRHMNDHLFVASTTTAAKGLAH